MSAICPVRPVATFPFLQYAVAHIDLGHYDIGNLIEVMRASETITVELVDFDFFVASEYFDIPSNNWTTAGSLEAITEAYALCVLTGG